MSCLSQTFSDVLVLLNELLVTTIITNTFAVNKYHSFYIIDIATKWKGFPIFFPFLFLFTFEHSSIMETVKHSRSGIYIY